MNAEGTLPLMQWDCLTAISDYPRLPFGCSRGAGGEGRQGHPACDAEASFRMAFGLMERRRRQHEALTLAAAVERMTGLEFPRANFESVLI